ncbi:hypothetical protein PAL_GLEAN10015065 [Pteropus alecto]|uniref:Uncharacterized protein n=1 Tax=Pteropus alecto TaxID=9402 RepID=L5JRU6_PTEAL|nr:hypothetical protein PAL_GLEAN10015065 [Pteropus alecto]
MLSAAPAISSASLSSTRPLSLLFLRILEAGQVLGLKNWIMSDFSAIGTRSWTHNPLSSLTDTAHPFTPQRHLAHTVTNR